MSGPVLVAVDEDAGAMRDVERELRDRYARHYRVVCIRSPREVLARLEELAAEGEQVALVLAGQRLSGMTGGELLDQARHLHPHAKRGLLMAWDSLGDRATGEAIFDSIARGWIDHYVVRPSEPSDEVFHQAISSLLLEWAEARRASPHTIHVVGESWSGRAYELRHVLGRCAFPHSFCLADSSDGRALVAEGREGAKLPIVVFPDGTLLSDPSNADLARAAGSPVNPERMHFDLVIVGAGPAGLSAAVYGASEGFSTLVVDEGGLGGQATSSSADPQLPRLPERRQRPPSGSAGVRAGVGFRGELRVHAEGDRPAARARRDLRYPLRQRPGAYTRGAPGDRRQLPPPRHPGDRGAERRRGLLWRSGFRGAGRGRPGRLRPRGRELSWTGCAAPRSLRPARHARGTCSDPRRRDVALPGTPGEGHAERAGPSRDRDRRRRG